MTDEELHHSMKIYHYEEQDILNYALNRVCRLCVLKDCTNCMVHTFRVQMDLQQEPSAFDQFGAVLLPDTFFFQTSINQLTCHSTYRASKEDDLYCISLPKIGEVCRLPIRKMEESIRNQRFHILPASDILETETCKKDVKQL